MDITTVISVIMTVIGAIALVAGGTVYIRSSWIKAQLSASDEALEGLRGDRDDLKERINIIEKQLQDERDHSTKLAQTIEECKTSIKTLEGIVTGRDELKRMLDILEARTQRFVNIEDRLDQVSRKLEEQHKE